MFRNRRWSQSGHQPQQRGPRLKHRTVHLEALEERKLLSAADIIAENARPGTSPDIWDISGSGSANIQGFAAQFSVDLGERVDFKIDTDADDYRIDVYRMGYYGGLGARLVTTIQPNASLANNQPNPLTDFQTGLVDAGNWRVSASWNVPETAVSGVYIAKLEREDGVFGESHIIFVVRDDDGQSDIVLQTSDTTWVAYSDYGGSSLYGNNFLPLGRAAEVSYNRPLTTRARAESTFFFGSEYPMVRFLEANGFDVSYTSGIDTDRRGEELLEHKLFISVGHDEYWSGQQRENVEAARDAGVNLAFFSGNEVFWKHRWEDSIAGTSTPYTTLVSYKETHDNAKTDPLDDVWTGTWRDPRFASSTDGGRPENSLTGTIFTVNGDGSIGGSIKVGADDGDMRFWRNTAVAELTGNQQMSVGEYVLGYEWDEDLDNGFRPAGLMHLSSTTAQVSSLIQDYGSTYAQGTATHHLTLYRAASGALVFGAGTIQFSWGLDDFHDGPATDSDRNMQQATINLFADMGVQPENLRPGLTRASMSTDFTKPTSTILVPIDGMVVAAGTALTIRGTAQDGGGGRVAAVEVSVDGGTTWHPATGREDWSYSWTPRSNGRVTILSRAADDSGNLEVAKPGITINPLADTGVYSFWDNGASPSTIDSGDNGAVEVGVRFRVDAPGFVTSIRFYKAAANTGTHTAHLWRADGTLLASAKFTSETSSGWQQVNFDTPVPISAGTTYIASYSAPNGRYSLTRNYFGTAGVDNGPLHAVPSGATGPNGVYTYNPGQFPNQSYQASNYWVDVVVNTEIASDVTAPTVTKFGQAGGAEIITVGSAFTVAFSEAVNPASLNSTTVTLVRPDNRLIPGGCCPTPGGWCSGCPLLNAVDNAVINATVSYDTATRTATIRPLDPLDPSTVYTIIVSAGGVKDLAGNALAVDTWSSIYTSNQPSPVQSTLFSTNTVPSTIDSGDKSAVELGMRFTADTDGLVTGARFYKSAANTGAHTASLWTSTGQLLATATFTAETASGWQQVNFNTPLAITAGTTYVISYHTNTGHYAVARNYFSSKIDSGTLNAPANAGVYAYGSGGKFPSQTYQGSNYYVDVVLSNTPAGDTLSPTITNFNPFDGSGNVPVNPSVKVYFSEAMDASTILPATVKLLDGGNYAVPATLSYDAATRTATLTPTSPLAYAMTYTTFVLGGAAGVRDLAGNTMAQNTTSAFSTDVGDVTDSTPPTITAFSPTDGISDVNIHSAISVTFSEPLNAATVRSNNVYLLVEGTRLVTAALTYDASARRATLTPAEPLSPSTSYTIYVLGGTTGVKDLFGNALVANVASVFVTAATSDTVAPSITSVTPSGTVVALGTPVTVSFSEPLNPSTVNGSTIQLRNTATGAVVPSTLSYTAGGTVATLTPTSSLSPSTSYSIVVQGGATGVKDLSGNSLASTATFSFVTAAPADTSPPTVMATSPAAGSSSVAINASITVTFNEPLNAATVNGSTLQLRNASTGAVIAANVSYTAGGTIATLTPTSSLSPSTSYSIVVQGGAAGVKDLSGNSLANTATFAFATAAAADTAPPTVTSINPSTGSLDVALGASVTIAFNESLNSATVNSGTVFLRDENGIVVSANVGYSAANSIVTLTPTVALTDSTSYTVVVKGGASGVKDLAGNALASDVTSTFATVAADPVPGPIETSSLWSTASTPGTIDSGDKTAVELGVKFTSTIDGYITGIRFYKSAANTGTHVGSLWNANGTLLANVTFTNESSSGWQLATFSAPVQIAAGTTYVASYHTNSSHYSYNRGYFSSAFTSGPLKVAANGGVYKYGSASAFPNSTYQGSNYWVDVVLSSTPPVDNTPPTVTATSPAGGSTNVVTTSAATITFNEALSASTVNAGTIFLRNAANQVVPTTITYNAANRTVSLTPTATLANSATYTIVVKGGASGVKDTAGNALASDFISSFTTRAAGVITASSMWNSSTTPGTVDAGDKSAVELGVKFSATTNGYITGIRYYKSAANTGPHTASLWTSGGQLLARATFTNETSSGWQEVLFDAPIAIAAGTTYVASYHTTSGHYSVNRNYFKSQFSSGYLKVPANGGVYSYGGTSAFPNSTYQGSNYWVDALFIPQ